MSLESQRAYIRQAKAKNDLRAAKTRFITGWIICAGGGLGMFASIAAMDAAETSGEGVGVWFLFMFTALAILLSGLAFAGDNGAAAQEEVDRLKHAMSNEKQRKKNQEYKRKRDLEDRERELNLANELMEKGGIENLNRAIGIFKKHEMDNTIAWYDLNDSVVNSWTAAEAKKKLAGELEEHLKYKEAIDIWEELGKHGEAKRVRKKMRDEGRVSVDQTVVHGDYVDDRDTIVKDSVISKSNIGAGGNDKFAKLKDLKEMLAEGLIDKDDFKEMKKEIMGK